MSEITVLIGPNLIKEVMENVRVVGETPQLSSTALQSLKSGGVVAAATEAWGTLTAMLQDIAGRGVAAIDGPLADFEEHLKRVMAELGDEAEGFRALLRDKIREAVDKSIDAALKNIKSRVLVGGSVYALASFTLQNKIAYTASMELSLTALCRFIAAGEIVATGTYNLVDKAERVAP